MRPWTVSSHSAALTWPRPASAVARGTDWAGRCSCAGCECWGFAPMRGPWLRTADPTRWFLVRLMHLPFSCSWRWPRRRNATSPRNAPWTGWPLRRPGAAKAEGPLYSIPTPWLSCWPAVPVERVGNRDRRTFAGWALGIPGAATRPEPGQGGHGPHRTANGQRFRFLPSSLDSLI